MSYCMYTCNIVHIRGGQSLALGLIFAACVMLNRKKNVYY